jgi:hypothetical protein
MSLWDWIFCLAFIAIGVIGGVVVGGVVQHHTAFIVAGICFALIGVVAIVSGSTARPALQDGPGGPEFHVFTNLAHQTWAWIAAAILLVATFAAFAIWPVH